jgi:hypothetical protein
MFDRLHRGFLNYVLLLRMMKTSFAADETYGQYINENYTDKREHQLFVGMLQMLWDRVEPSGYTHHVTENPLPGTNVKGVLMRAAIADHQVANLSSHVMARTMKAKHLDTGQRDIWALDEVPSTSTGEDGVCSYPTLSECGPDEDDAAAQALCMPTEAP